MYSLIRKSTIVVTDSNPTVIKFALKEKKQIIILTSKEKMTKLEKNYYEKRQKEKINYWCRYYFDYIITLINK